MLGESLPTAVDQSFRRAPRRTGAYLVHFGVILTFVAIAISSSYQLDLETILPRERLQELADGGAIGAAAREHYSFMGATDPAEMEPPIEAAASAISSADIDVVPSWRASIMRSASEF